MQVNISPTEQFRNRHTSATIADRAEMLKTIGVSSIDELIYMTIPDNIRLTEELDIEAAESEVKFLESMRGLAAKNDAHRSYIGMGYYGTHTPNVILRNILENPGWYTAYTPYQAEIAQGRLEALLNFQTMIIDLSGMEIANSSLLDEGTAAAEAMGMFLHLKSRKKPGMKFFADASIFPQTLEVVKTRCEPLGVELIIGDASNAELNEDYFGALLQYPNNEGNAIDHRAFCEHAASNDIKVAVAADIMSLVMLTPPGEWGADAVIGTTQRFGVPMGFGGPHAAFMATKEEYKRQVPGRIIGVSVDAAGKNAYRMALQTREQHIKRDKATSNICTAQVLLAIMAGMYGVYHGPDGLKRIAGKIHGLTKKLDNALSEMGYAQQNANYFDTLHVVDLSGEELNKIQSLALGRKINLRYMGNTIGIAIDETCNQSDIQDIVNCFAEARGVSIVVNDDDETVTISNELLRTSEFMNHKVFNSFYSEHEMLRYMKSLENKDLSLVHSMISLGSCTMKLNATVEMIPVTWPEFSNVHPFVPRNQVAGYLELLEELKSDLVQITGFDDMSFQPNAGAQGEYAGLMVIRQYLDSMGQGHRNIALIPASAHGTNPASAVMAGMKVVVVKTLDNGYIDMVDWREKADLHSENLACAMITYPSTNGVYEETIKEIIKIVHDNGAQVYMDGANMNAQVGLTNPGTIGADVCHLNLHKTFAIPHGGGGPGMGPIGVAKHLSPFLPKHAVTGEGSPQSMTAVSASHYGSANVLIISYAYIKMLGSVGLKEATEVAILNANYLKAKLDGHFDMLFKGTNGSVAHEMIIETRPFKQSSGVKVEDIAKRLMDYGFHAPTVSFPIAGTLMVEPTESESKEELDRFCDAMIGILAEIRQIENGEFPQDNNPLVNAPHPADVLLDSNWDRPYSREIAAYPLDWVKDRKFWPSVSRVDNSYGDRNLVCACLPIEAYAEG
jgi:glycine dehydrogenase